LMQYFVYLSPNQYANHPFSDFSPHNPNN